MSKVTQDYFPRTINQYVPSMEFAADVVDGVHIVSLGAPAAADPDGILDGVSATNSAQTYTSADWAAGITALTSTTGMLDAPYGRCLTAVGTAGSNHVVTITGRDYLGQIMSEALTLSGTSTIYGEKAFKFVDTVGVAAGAASDTFDLGWDDRLGLPYKAEHILSWTEDDVQKDLGTYVIPIDAVDLVSADTVFGVSMEAGFVTRLDTVLTVAGGSGSGTLTVEIGGTAIAGISTAVGAGGSIGDLDFDPATDDHGATTKLGTNSAIEVVSNGGASTAGTADARITVQRAVFFIDGDETTPSTTTGDTRGTVQPHTACDGSVEYEVRYTVDTSNLHGAVQA